MAKERREIPTAMHHMRNLDARLRNAVKDQILSDLFVRLKTNAGLSGARRRVGRVERLYGVEGRGWILPDLSERWADADRRATILKVGRMLEVEPSVLGCSAHLLIVARKTADNGTTAA